MQFQSPDALTDDCESTMSSVETPRDTTANSLDNPGQDHQATILTQ
mgnify:CR=1 FL=1